MLAECSCARLLRWWVPGLSRDWCVWPRGETPAKLLPSCVEKFWWAVSRGTRNQQQLDLSEKGCKQKALVDFEKIADYELSTHESPMDLWLDSRFNQLFLKASKRCSSGRNIAWRAAAAVSEARKDQEGHLCLETWPQLSSTTTPERQYVVRNDWLCLAAMLVGLTCWAVTWLTGQIRNRIVFPLHLVTLPLEWHKNVRPSKF